MASHKDLDAVRELRSAESEPTDLAVTRVRQRVISGLDGPSTVHAGRRAWLAVVGSAAAALLVIVGLAVAFQAGRGNGGGQQAAVDPSPSLSAEPTPAPATVDMSVTPVQVPAGQYLYVRRSAPDYIHEVWLDVEGALPVCIVRTDNGVERTMMNPDQDAQSIASARAEFERNGPSFNYPTPAFLAALPTDPSALLSMIVGELQGNGQGGRIDLIFKNTLYLLSGVEPLLSPELRAAFVAALSSAPGAIVDRTPRAFASHDVYVVQQNSTFATMGLLVDSASGRLVGDYAGGDGATPDSAEAWTHGVAPKACQRP